MKKKTQPILIAIIVVLLSFTGCNEPEKKITPKIPVEDFFRNAERYAYKISPEGNYISFLQMYGQRLNIHIKGINDNDTLRLTEVLHRDIRDYFWANEKTLLYLMDKDGDENYLLYAIDIISKKISCLTNFENVQTQIIDLLTAKPDFVLIGLNKRNPECFDAYQLNLLDGELTLVAENPGNIQEWFTDHNGKIRIATTLDGLKQGLLYRETEKDDFRQTLTFGYEESFVPLFFAADNQSLYAVSNIGRDKKVVVSFDPATGNESEVVYENPEYDVDKAFYSDKKGKLSCISYISWREEQYFTDEEMKLNFMKIRKKVGDWVFYMDELSQTLTEDKLVVRTYNDKSRGAYYLFDKVSGEVRLLDKIASWMPEEGLCSMKAFQFITRDNQTIHGYLTLPDGDVKEGLPMVVAIHGGPWEERDFWHYDRQVQFLANRGYAVLQVNFRGSYGYGKEFQKKSFKQWGRDMQNDITDAVKWAISEGIADSNRVAIMGVSYGGYAALAGLTFTPDLYACGIDLVGISNIFTLYESFPAYWRDELEMMYEKIGHPKNDSLLLCQISPLFHVDQIKAPVLIAQGAMDPRVNKNESEQMVKALREKGVEVEYILKENEGHGFSNVENKIDLYNAIDLFLEKHLKPPKYSAPQ